MWNLHFHSTILNYGKEWLISQPLRFIVMPDFENSEVFPIVDHHCRSYSPNVQNYSNYKKNSFIMFCTLSTSKGWSAVSNVAIKLIEGIMPLSQ